MARIGQNGVKLLKLLPVGELSHQQKISDLLIAEGAVFHIRFDKVVNIDAAVIKAAGARYPLAVLQIVALDAADACNAGHNAGPILVTQTLFYGMTLILFGIYRIFPAYILA